MTSTRPACGLGLSGESARTSLFVQATSCQRRRRERLARDDRGAIAIMGLFMALFLVGALWYVIGVGDAILFRERVQDGTDAVAFTAAVYHARTMNMIASLNIVLSVLLGVLIAARLVQFLNNLVYVIAVLCSAVPVTAPVCAPVATVTGSLRPVCKTAVKAAETLYDTAGPALNLLQKALAIAGPWYAEYKSVGAARDFAPDVEGGFTVGVSLAPGIATGSERLALPVQEGKPAQLCARTSEGIVNLVFTPFGGLADDVKDLVGDEVIALIATFCDGGGEALEQAGKRATNKRVEEAARAHCEWSHALHGTIYALRRDYMAARSDPRLRALNQERLDSIHRLAGGEQTDKELHPCYGARTEHLFRGEPRASDLTLIGETELCARPGPNYVERCIERVRPHFERKAEGARQESRPTEGESLAPAEDDPVPFVMFGEAQPGDAHFQVYGVVWTNRERIENDGPLVAIATRGTHEASAPDALSEYSLAQAEFFYDGPYDPVESMWNLRWRASLRRLWPPKASEIPGLDQLAKSDVLGRVTEQVEKLLGAIEKGPLSKGLDLILGNELAEKVRAQARDARRWSQDPEGMAWTHFGAVH